MMNETEMTFEAALSRLEEIVRELENGAAPLNESLQFFEEGIHLVKLCGTHLDDAEQRIRILTKKEDGGYVEQSFGGN